MLGIGVSFFRCGYQKLQANAIRLNFIIINFKILYNKKI